VVAESGVEVALMRGGTSRGVVLELKDLAPAGLVRDEQARALIGRSPVDGLGGGTPITNKVVLVGPSGSAAADLDYIVGNISSDGATVDWSGTCGNMTSVVLPFAGSKGLIERAPDTGVFVLRNLATDGLVEVTVAAGNEAWPVDATEVRLTTAFLEPGGAVLERTLPSGNPRDEVEVDGERFEFSLIDVTHPYLFLRYEQVVGDRELADAETEARIESIRGTVCVGLGLCDAPEKAATTTPAVPRVVLVHAETDPGADVRIDAISMGRAITSVPVTAALNIAAARGIEGTVLGGRHQDGALQVVVEGPTGSLAAEALVDADGKVLSASVDRTARALMVGRVWVS
jgi:2-methylaconitate cis-trans-isomerase PrpF